MVVATDVKIKKNSFYNGIGVQNKIKIIYCFGLFLEKLMIIIGANS